MNTGCLSICHGKNELQAEALSLLWTRMHGAAWEVGWRNVLNEMTWEQQEQGEMEMRAEMLLRQTTEIASELPAYVSNSWLVKEL